MCSSEGRAYGPLTLTLGLGLLAMGIALSLQMIGSVVGPFDLVGAAPAGTPTLGVWLPGSAGYDARTENRRRARSWRAALAGRVAVREAGSLEALAGQGVRAEKSFAYPYRVLETMATEGVTGFPGVPTMFSLLLRERPSQGRS